MNVTADLIRAAEHALKVFESLAARGRYPQELLPFDDHGQASDLFMGEQGFDFLIKAIANAKEAISGDWVEWHGGECPVPGKTEVEYIMRGYPEQEPDAQEADCLDWSHGATLHPHAEIIRYRVIRDVDTRGPIKAWLATMKTSKGNEYYVCVGRPSENLFDRTYMTPQMYYHKGRAELDVAEWNAMLNGTPRPDMDDFDLDTIG